MGRDYLTDGEIRKIYYAENLLKAYGVMKQTADWVIFMNREPYWAAQIDLGARLSEEME